MQTELTEIFKSIVAPEANFLLTEPPKVNLDFGWFCREHCLIACVIAALHGQKLNVTYGDVTLNSGPYKFSTIETSGNKHWWCTAPGLKVFDMSVSTKFLSQSEHLMSPIFNYGTQGAFNVIEAKTSEEHLSRYSSPHIIYTAHKRLNHTAQTLVKNPKSFLATEESCEITARIFLHIFDMIRGRRESYQEKATQGQALRDLRTVYPNALNKMRGIIEFKM